MRTKARSTWTRSGPCRTPLFPGFYKCFKTGEFSCAGSGTTIHVDVRVIASTTQLPVARDVLWQELRRLNPVEIWIPPLRQRPEEIPALASFFLEGDR